MIKKAIFEVVYVFLRIFGGKAFSDRKFQPHKLLKCFIWQKIFRINGHVPWPVHKSTKVIRPENIDRGDRCPGFAMNGHIDGRNGITFGNNVWVGPRVSIISMNHDINDYHAYKPEKPIKIGDNCWLGVNAVILPGVELGNHVVVGAGSIVTKSFGDNVLIGGNPAKVIRELEPYGAAKAK